MEKTVKVTLEVPVELYEKWTRRAGDDLDTLSAALIEYLRYPPHRGRRDPKESPSKAPLPLCTELPWGRAWSRRWNDLKAEKFKPEFDPNDPSCL